MDESEALKLLAGVEVHEAANIFPLDAESLDKLAEDIRQSGQQVPIERLDGKILDGRRRYLACRKAGVVPKYKDVRTDDPVAYVLSLNLHRRHLSPTQLAMVAAKARKWYDEQAKERQKNHGGTAPGKRKTLVENLPQVNPGAARDHAGKAVGVSGKAVDQATKVLRDGTPALVAAVEADRIAVSTAAKFASQSEAEQDALVQRTRERAANGRPPKPRPTVASQPEGGDPDTDPAARRSRGKGIALAHQAINCLQRIPRNDGLRAEGLKMVGDWIKAHK